MMRWVIAVLSAVLTVALGASAAWGQDSAGGRVLMAGSAIWSDSGRYVLQMELSGNLVLYDTHRSPGTELWPDGGGAYLVLWQTHTSGHSGARAVLGPEGDLSIVAVGRAEALWRSQRAGNGMSMSVSDAGDLTIGHNGRDVWTVGASTPRAGIEGKHIVYDTGSQRMWLFDGELMYDTYPVSGRLNTPWRGTYEVFSKSETAWYPRAPVTMAHMVRFVKGTEGRLNIGFHAIPRTYGGAPVQTESELGTAQSAGCVRQSDEKAEHLYRWAEIGTPVVVTQ